MGPPKIDETVARVLDKKRADDSDDEDELLAELEQDDAALDGFREKRMQQLRDEMLRARQLKDLQHGEYTTVESEKAVMDITTSTHLTIVHFAHADFRRCKIMDTHLHHLAPQHVETRFVKVDVEKAPFLVERLGVRVLPCVMGFVDGKGVGRIEGFEVLGNTDGFKTVVLERNLVALGVLERVKGVAEDGGGGVGGMEKEEEEDEGSDWD